MILQQLSDLTPLLFILIATILTNFVGDTIGCKFQKIFTFNIFFKHIIIVFLIYSIISVINKDDDPKAHMIKSIGLWILFMLFIKNTFRITIILSVFMITLFIIENFKNYYFEKNIEYYKKLDKLSSVIKTIIFVLLIVGHIYYIVKTKKITGDDFDLFKLYKGTSCHII